MSHVYHCQTGHFKVGQTERQRLPADVSKRSVHTACCTTTPPRLKCGEWTVRLMLRCKHCLAPVIGFVLQQAFPPTSIKNPVEITSTVQPGGLLVPPRSCCCSGSQRPRVERWLKVFLFPSRWPEYRTRWKSEMWRWEEAGCFSAAFTSSPHDGDEAPRRHLIVDTSVVTSRCDVFQQHSITQAIT